MDKTMQKRAFHGTNRFVSLGMLALAAVIIASPRAALGQDATPPQEPGGAADAEPPTVEPTPSPSAPAPPASGAIAPPAQGAIGATPEPPPPAMNEAAPTDAWIDRQGPPPNAIQPPLSGLGDCANDFSNDVARGTQIDWHACMAIDIGYAKYTFDSPGVADEDFYGFLGRFVLGPVLQHDFAAHYYVRAVGQLVGWVREQVGTYQVNVDDVYAEVGDKHLWDIRAGRFMTWAVAQRGRGFDLYTLEDSGAIKQSPWEGNNFGVYKYEVNNIWLQEPPGRVALHVFPLPVFGVELAGVYGKASTVNNLGGRGVAVFQNDFLRLAAGGEYRHSRLAVTPTAVDPTGATIECPRCGVTERYGFGGSAVITFSPVEAGVDAARGFVKSNTIKDGTHDPTASTVTTTLGGYLQLDAGALALHRSLVLESALYRTEKLNDVEEYERHTQMAAYIYFPLGFENAGLKLVGSRALEHFELSTGDGVTFTGYDSAMTALRLRFEYYY